MTQTLEHLALNPFANKTESKEPEKEEEIMLKTDEAIENLRELENDINMPKNISTKDARTVTARPPKLFASPIISPPNVYLG